MDDLCSMIVAFSAAGRSRDKALVLWRLLHVSSEGRLASLRLLLRVLGLKVMDEQTEKLMISIFPEGMLFFLFSCFLASLLNWLQESRLWTLNELSARF